MSVMGGNRADPEYQEVLDVAHEDLKSRLGADDYFLVQAMVAMRGIADATSDILQSARLHGLPAEHASTGAETINSLLQMLASMFFTGMRMEQDRFERLSGEALTFSLFLEQLVQQQAEADEHAERSAGTVRPAGAVVH